MDFLAINDDVKLIISKHLASDLKIRTLLSKNHDLKKNIIGDIVYDDDFCKYLKLQYDAKENDDFKNAKYSRYTKISQILEMSYILVLVLVIH
jgi:hypothetical protein